MKAVLDGIELNGLYGPKEAVALLGCSRAQFYRYVSSGALKYEVRRSTGKRVFRGSAILSFHSRTS